MGKIAVPLTSFSTTIGLLVTGSIIRPRIFISTSIWRLLPTLVYTLSGQRIGPGPSHAHIHVEAAQVFARGGWGEIGRLVLRSAADPLARGLVEPLHQALFHAPDIGGVLLNLNPTLL